MRRAQSWAAEQSRWVQYPPERMRPPAARRGASAWLLWLNLQMARAWLAIVGVVAVAGMLYAAYCFAWAVVKFG